MLIKTIITGYPNLSRFQQGSHPENFANDMCFEILGFDVILNHKLNPQILEVNYTPSFTTDTPFDKMVKKNLIYDSLKLLNLTEKWKR
jgi:tubulin polyglutamylase TTLL6/13